MAGITDAVQQGSIKGCDVELRIESSAIGMKNVTCIVELHEK